MFPNITADARFGRGTVKRISEGKDQNKYFTA
jgi:hypothetical protein